MHPIWLILRGVTGREGFFLLEIIMYLYFLPRIKTLYHTEKQGFGYPWFLKKIADTPTKTH